VDEGSPVEGLDLVPALECTGGEDHLPFGFRREAAVSLGKSRQAIVHGCRFPDQGCLAVSTA
jgi:hypothetical protein